MLKVTRQGFYKYMANKDKPYKYADLCARIREIIDEDMCNDTYSSQRIYDALNLKKEKEGEYFPRIPHERTVYRIMKHENLVRKPKKKPNGITKADKEAQKSDNLLNQDFKSEKPYEKAVTDITEIPCKDGKLYVSAVFDCFNNEVLGLSTADNMRAELVRDTLVAAVSTHPELRNNAIIHSDRGSQYTSDLYRKSLEKYGIKQSMNSAAGRCHDNAKCESMWARFKNELIYGRFDTKQMLSGKLKSIIWRYFMSYWNNRRICSANGGFPPFVKKLRYYQSLSSRSLAA
jgi:transposase InsO family protein